MNKEDTENTEDQVKEIGMKKVKDGKENIEDQD